MKSNLGSLTVLAVLLSLGPTGAWAQAKTSKRKIAPLERLSTSFQYLAQRVSPAVVQIVTRGYGPVQGQSSGTVATQSGTGSGVILDPEGYIVTNAHVVQGAQKVRVLISEEPGVADEERRIQPRGQTVPATIVGLDSDSDLAVIKIDLKNLPFLELADSSKLRQGQVVLACGSPLGLENTVSVGVISSVGRQVRPEDTMVYIQTDAPINPGNSGGALVDTSGKVVGINTFILTQSGGSEGLGFAIPSNVIKNIYTQIRKDGHAHRGFIGVQARTITPQLALGLKLSRDWGVILEDVAGGSPADIGGLRPGDLVLSLDGRPLPDARRFEIMIYQSPIGASIDLEILRGADTLNLSVTVAERANDPNRFADLVTKESNLISQLGILVLNVNEEVAKLLPSLRKPAGVVVAARLADAPSLDEDFQTGDLICSINGEGIADLQEFRDRLNQFQSGAPIVAQIQRQGRLMLMVFEMP
jgi:serine protease Do